MSFSWHGRHVLVTGGTGFIGSFLVERLLDGGAKVKVPIRVQNYRALSSRRDAVDWLEGDLRDATYCSHLVSGIDYVFHLAAYRRNIDFHQKKCGDVTTGNIQMTIALLEALRELPSIPPVTFFSTANVPPSIDIIAMAQRERVDGYLLGKAMCETLWFAAAHQRDFPLLVIRPVGAYGPRDTFSEDGNVIPSLMLRARDSKDVLNVWGSGDQERAFLYVKDLVEAVMKLVESDAKGVQYVVPPDVLPVRVLAERIRSLINPKLEIVFDASKPEGSRTLPRLPMHEILHSVAWTSLDDGLKETVEWWRSAR